MRNNDLRSAEVRPFVVRQFEGTPWVPLHEAARLHDAVQESGLTIATLRNDRAALRLRLERLAVAVGDFKWEVGTTRDEAGICKFGCAATVEQEHSPDCSVGRLNLAYKDALSVLRDLLSA